MYIKNLEAYISSGYTEIYILTYHAIKHPISSFDIMQYTNYSCTSMASCFNILRNMFIFHTFKPWIHSALLN